MTNGEIISLITGVLGLFLYTAAFSYWIGGLSSRVKENSNDITGIGNKTATLEATSSSKLTTLESDFKDGIQSVKDELRTCNSDLYNEFVTIKKCESEREHFLEQRDIYNAQNSKEHEALLKQGEKTEKALTKISECLHKLQNKKECD